MRRRRLRAAGFAPRCTVYGAGGGDGHGVGGERVVVPGGPAGGGAAVEALNCFVAREGVAAEAPRGVHSVPGGKVGPHPVLFGETGGQKGVARGGCDDLL